MFLYLFEDLGRVACNWHPEGGLVVVAKSSGRAKYLIEEKSGVYVTDGEWENVSRYKLANSDAKEAVYVFPAYDEAHLFPERE